MRKTKPTIEVVLGSEQVNDLVRRDLMESYEFATGSTKEAIRRVIRYYSTDAEYYKWKEDLIP